MRTTTWENIGTDVTGSTSILEAIHSARLDFNVSKQPLYTDYNGSKILIPEKMATVREDTGDILGVVGKDYNVCQNADAFEFVDYVSDDLMFEKAGMTNSGMVYVIAKLPDVSILEDSFTPHLIFQNGFNGGYSVKAAICPLRIVCQNQLALSFARTPNSVSIRHSSSLQDKLMAAKQTFLETTDYMNELNAEAERLAAKPFSKADFQRFLDSQFEIKDDMTDLQKQRLDEARTALMNAYFEPDNANFVGTSWGILNAVSDYLTHKTPSRKSKNFEDNKFMSVTFNPAFLQAVYERVSF